MAEEAEGRHETKLLLASRNPKKLGELERILAGAAPGLRVLGLDDVEAYPEPIEDQATFEGNALLKARAGFAATGLVSLADDSGLCVDALNGMPGVLSARWSGKPKSDERNNLLLLDQLEDVPDERRAAHFVSVVAVCHAGGEFVVTGEMHGHVIRELRGTDGFGYDVLFVPDGTDDDRTSAELSKAEKDAISHRGKALREVASRLPDIL